MLRKDSLAPFISFLFQRNANMDNLFRQRDALFVASLLVAT